MSQRSSSKSGLFLIELIIAIVFFAVASAACMQLFVNAHLINIRSNDLSTASIIAQNAAEELKIQRQNAAPSSFYGKQGEALDSSAGAVYRLECTGDAGGGTEALMAYTISVYKLTDEGEPIFTLPIKSYINGSTVKK